MATETPNKPQELPQTKTAEPSGFGAYSTSSNTQNNLRIALNHPPEAKISGSLAFTEADKRWLKDLGITTSDPYNFHKAWRTDKQNYDRAHRQWADMYTGRLGMRTISRGIVGAAFYAAGNMYVDKAMDSYSHNVKFGELIEDGKILQFIAKCIDDTAGRAVKTVYKGITGNEKRAEELVTGFRNTKHYSGYAKDHRGRSLGDEAMMVTFDFASMSFGDYMTRYVIGLFDPNAKKHWMKDGHLDVPGGIKDLMQNMFRGVTYAAGEDMAVALPYVYYMRAQRHIIDKFSPGFKYDADRALNGGSYKLKNDKIIGDYQLEGMADLMGRFSVYNVGTKMFRDGYSKVQSHYEHFVDRWKEGDHSLPIPSVSPQLLTAHGVKKAVADTARYIARTTIKVMTYMIPATFFFFITRSPQQKVNGLAIDVEGKGILGRYLPGLDPIKQIPNVTHTVNANQSLDPNYGFQTNETNSGQQNFNTIGPGSSRAHDLNPDYRKPNIDRSDQPFKEDMVWIDKHGIRSEFKGEYPFSMGKDGKYGEPQRTRRDTFTDKYYNGTPPWYHKITAPIGKFCHDAGSTVKNLVEGPAKKIGLKEEIAEQFSRLYANAALSYTPYFMMKTDVLSAEWDTERTDMAIDRALNGLAHLNWGEFKAGIGETRRALMREPFTEVNREELAQMKRWGRDPEHRSNEAFQLYDVDYAKALEENTDTSQTTFTNDNLRAKKITPTLTQLKSRTAPESWAAQEAVRKFKQESPSADGQAIH